MRHNTAAAGLFSGFLVMDELREVPAGVRITRPAGGAGQGRQRLEYLRELERKVLWLATWM
ncbi:MAG TPA: hypothetical protein VJY33_04745, partial [Isosphaeraceae bacterium]|nr:hypothetical protein [Isosphaeraceae bacterium]